MIIPSMISPITPMPKGIALAIKGMLSNFKMGNNSILTENANPALNKTGMFLVSKIGMNIIIAPTRKKIKKNI